MTGRVDGFHTRKPEVPNLVQERRTPPLAPSTWMGIRTGFLLKPIQRVRNSLNRLELSGKSQAQRRNDTDGISVTARDDLFGRHEKSPVLPWDLAMLDIPIPGEFVPADPDREMEFLTNNLCWSAGSVATPKKFSLREPKKFLNRLRRQPPANPLQSENTRAISVLYGTIVMRNTQQNSAPINL